MRQGALFDHLPVPPARFPAEPIVRAALIDGDCRFWLKRAWGAGPLIAWVMCNPSTADAERDDPTMRRVIEFSLAWGYGSCVVINIIPFISSAPAQALAWAKRADIWMPHGDPPTPEWDQWRENISICVEQINAAKAHIVAWGNEPAGYSRLWLQDIAEASGADFDDEHPEPIDWLCLGTTMSGAPKHPLARGQHRVPADFKPIKWSAQI